MLDEETIGHIEKELDRMISETDMRERMRWVLKEIPVGSQEEFALGYLIGSLTSHAYDVTMKLSNIKKIDKRWKRKIEKEMGKERLREIERKREEIIKDVKPPRVYWTKKEDTQIRNMMIRRLVQIRRKVHRDFHR